MCYYVGYIDCIFSYCTQNQTPRCVREDSRHATIAIIRLLHVATLQEKQYLLSVELPDIGPPCHLLYIIPFPNHSGYGIQTGSGWKWIGNSWKCSVDSIKPCERELHQWPANRTEWTVLSLAVCMASIRRCFTVGHTVWMNWVWVIFNKLLLKWIDVYLVADPGISGVHAVCVYAWCMWCLYVWCGVLVCVWCDVWCLCVCEHLLQKCALVQNHKVIERDILQQDFGKHVHMQSELSVELEQQVMQCCWPLCKGNSDLHNGSISVCVCNAWCCGAVQHGTISRILTKIIEAEAMMNCVCVCARACTCVCGVNTYMYVVLSSLFVLWCQVLYVTHVCIVHCQLRKRYEGTVEERNSHGLSLIERNEELSIFFE